MTGLSGASGTWSADGQACAMFVADIAGFTRPDRDEEIQSHLRHALYGTIREAFAGSGISWGDCLYQDRGDGPLVILPPAIPPHVIITRLPERLRYLIRRSNRCASQPARMQVRAALNIGPVYCDEHGYSGEDVNLLCRMLDAPPLKRLLIDTDTELALMVSSRVYDTIVLRHPSMADPALFLPVRARVKRTRIDAWIYAPDNPSLGHARHAVSSSPRPFGGYLVPPRGLTAQRVPERGTQPTETRAHRFRVSMSVYEAYR